MSFNPPDISTNYTNANKIFYITEKAIKKDKLQKLIHAPFPTGSLADKMRIKEITRLLQEDIF